MVISNHNTFRVLFDNIASVYFIWKIYQYSTTGNCQAREPALCQLYRHTSVPYRGIDCLDHNCSSCTFCHFTSIRSQRQYDTRVMVGYAHTCLKYHCHRVWHAHTKAQGKNMTLVKRENCTAVKCFKPNTSSINQCTGYCFATSAIKSLNGVVPCFEHHQSSAKYPGKEVGWTLFAFLMIFFGCVR